MQGRVLERREPHGKEFTEGLHLLFSSVQISLCVREKHLRPRKENYLKGLEGRIRELGTVAVPISKVECFIFHKILGRILRMALPQ